MSVCVELEQANNGLAEMGFPVDWLQADLSNVNNASLECRRAIEITWRLLAFDDNLVCGELISNELEMREMLGKFADGDSASRWFLEMALARAHRERREFNEAQQNSERARRILLDNGRWKSDLGLSVSADLLFVSALRHDTTLDGSKLLLWNELEHVPDKFGTQLAIRFALALSAYCLVESDRDGAASLASRAQLMLKSHPLGSVHNPDYGETFCNMLLVLSTSQLTESETVLNSFDAFRDSLDRKDDIRAPEVRWFVLTRIADYLVVRRRPLAARLMNELAEKQFDSQ
ncbi:MAG: hypothetical protein NT069_20795 [Planctomycetota bacterium]|nr:hypothetical protein [Planctomycetota bacterium]